MKKIIDYTIMDSDSRVNLETQVVKAIRNSWQPLGGMVVGNLEGTNKQYFQTMVRYEQ